jgi:hypothetical protein
VVGGSGNQRTASLHVIVDHTPPEVEIIHPLDGAVYTLESDECVNIQVDAVDAFSMDRVEFFLDGNPIGFTTVAPFTLKWTIALSDTVPRMSVDPAVISATNAITIEELYIEENALLDGTVFTVTRSITDNAVITRTVAYTTGFGIIADTLGYTETHLIHVVAFDAAGNQAESEKVRFYTAHMPKEEPEPTPTPVPAPLSTCRCTLHGRCRTGKAECSAQHAGRRQRRAPLGTVAAASVHIV